MADRLEEMMYRVCILKDRYKKLKKELDSSVFFEFDRMQDEALINGIPNLIKEIEQNINREIEILSKTIRISDVVDKALILSGDINIVKSKANITYMKWREAILDVSKSYINAYNSFEKIMKEQEEHQQNVANIAASVASVLSMGGLSWLSTAVQISDDIIAKADTIKNIAEDVAQGLSDKFISHVVPKQVSSITVLPKGPLMFKNNITKELIHKCIIIFEKIHAIMESVNNFAKIGNDLSSKGIGRKGGDKDSLNAFSLYRKLLKETQPIIAQVANWSDIEPSKVNETKLINDFERNFWAKWLISLETHPIVTGIDIIYIRNNKGDIVDIKDIVETKKEDKSKIVYRKFFWSHSLKSKLEELFKLDNTVIEGGDLGIYVSVTEIKRLVTWAKSHRPVQAL